MAPPEKAPEALNPEEALKHAEKGDLDSLRKEIAKAMEIEELDKIAGLINANLEKLKKDVLPEIKKTLQRKVEELQKHLELEKKLEALQSRVELLKLIPELAKKKISLFREKAEEYAKKAGEWVAKGLEEAKKLPVIGVGIGWLQTFFGETAPEIGKNLWRWGKRAFYSVLASPSLLGVDEKTPFVGKVVNWAKEKLAQEDCMEAIRGVVEAEGNPDVAFDGTFNKGAWLRLSRGKKPEEMYAHVQDLALKFIDAEKKAGIAKFSVSMASLLKIDEIQKEAEAKKDAALKELVKAHWNVETVTFGETLGAKRESGKWTITIPKTQIDEKGAPTTDAGKKLLEALPVLTNVDEITIGDGAVKFEKPKEKIKVTIAPRTAQLDVFNKIAEEFKRNLRLMIMQRVTAGLPLGDPVVKFDGHSTLEWNNIDGIETVLANQLPAIHTDIMKASAPKQWEWSGGKWNPKP